MGNMRRIPRRTIATMTLLCCSCQSHVINRTDRDVYRLIEDRQNHALGTTSDADIGAETGDAATGVRRYSFTPHPVEPGLPPAFQTPVEPAGADDRPPDGGETETGDADGTAPDAEDTAGIFTPAEEAHVQVFGLKDVLAYAFRYGRNLQDAKEELYLAALDLTLERHLWTPQFVASVTADAEFKDPGGLNDDERALAAVGEIALTQRLPYGGELTAGIISTLVRDLEDHVTSAETGRLIIDANIPLLRGAGRAAYESRYSRERELIYAVRAFERFRRSYLVDVASRYFNLQQTKARITNAFMSYQSRKQDWEKAAFVRKVGRSRDVVEEPRALASFRAAESTLVSAKEQYATALDRFKIFIGMPVDGLLDVVDQEDDVDSMELDALLPEIDIRTSIEIALCYRLDLLTSADRLDDSHRAVAVAKNGMLPDLDLTAGVTLDSRPERLDSLEFSTERSTYRTGVTFQLNDRRRERNAYRASLVALRQAQRDHEERVDSVRADVRRAVRRIREQETLRVIETLNVEENELRAEAARAQVDLGKSTNQDVVDAEEVLLGARNRLAAAVAGYRNAILDFRLDTGTVRVADDGSWEGVRTSGSATP